MTPDYPFTAARVLIMVAVDIVLYALLAFYLDKVCTSAVPPKCPLMPLCYVSIGRELG